MPFFTVDKCFMHTISRKHIRLRPGKAWKLCVALPQIEGHIYHNDAHRPLWFYPGFRTTEGRISALNTYPQSSETFLGISLTPRILKLERTRNMWNSLPPEVFPSCDMGFFKKRQQGSQRLITHRQLVWYCRYPWATNTTSNKMVHLLVFGYI